uniref:NADH-ubiquinone oxidoreductase chain 4 n=1 Tax=Ophirina amphinema TaxID=2108040 RepID=A0A348AYT1_9EUKA|nr:NADH dehydrogenase subunit 4 [Ophirina amphinema]
MSAIIGTLLIGSIIMFFVPSNLESAIKVGTLVFSLCAFLLSLLLWYNYDYTLGLVAFTYDHSWIGNSGFSLTMGVDGVSISLIALTTFLIPACILCSWRSIRSSVKEYYICFLVLDLLLVLVFSSLDLFLFYIFFEGVLIPMFLLIGIWGSSERRVYASYMLFLYTLAGSLLMLLAVIYIYLEVGTTNIVEVLDYEFGLTIQKLLWVCFFTSFAVKMPMVPFHIWLPEAHVEAPTAGSVLLAGVLLKLGGYGFYRMSIPLFPDATVYFAPFVLMLSVVAIVYASLTTLRQVDLKRVIAYSSVAHMGFVTLGMFSLNVHGIEGSILLMLSHGVVSSALFLCVGVLYDRHKTRIINYYGGLTRVMPMFSVAFLLFTMANISLPGTSSFVGEFLSLLGCYEVSTFMAFIASIGVVLGAGYSIWLYNRVCFGNLKIDYVNKFTDLSRREYLILLPFAIFTILFGIYPDLFLNLIHFSVLNIIEYCKF